MTCIFFFGGGIVVALSRGMVFGDVCRFQTTPSKLKLLIDFSRSRRWMEDLVLGLGKWAQRGWQKATEIKTFVRRDWFQLCLLSEMRRFVDMYGFWKGFYQAWCVEMMLRSDQTRPNGVGTQSSIFNLFVVDIPCTFVMCFGFPWKKQQKHQKTSVKPRRRFKEVIFLGPEKRSLGGLES